MLPRQRTQAAVIPIGVTSTRGLELPQDPRVVGWWSGGALPGSTTGSVLLAGHLDVVKRGPGPLAALFRVSIGDAVEVVGPAGTPLRYRVTARHTYPKAALPSEVFRANGPAVLTLVTCGGPFDPRTHHYRDNVVVSASPVPG